MEKTFDLNTVYLTDYGRQDCSDMHSCGPGIRDCYVLHYVLSGKGYFKVENQTYALEAGDSFFFWPYTVTHYYPDPEDPWTYQWVNFVSGEKNTEIFGFSPKSPVCRIEDKKALEAYFERLLSLNSRQQHEREATGLLYAILGLYQDQSRQTRPLKEDERAARALDIIRANYHKSEFGVAMLCELMEENRVALYRLFMQKWGTSPSQFIIDYRIGQAKMLLSMGNNVKMTALSCGFSDPLYFSKVYKKRMGVNPSKS
ncbi:MAG: AraC family transcriptional regulator [Lachnospiraceae bacterium]|nr:AraC family transcriptional regulator [Lachnospiraceae bacterium]